MKTTDSSPRSYDHRDIDHLVEYWLVAESIQRLGQAFDQMDDPTWSRVEFIEAIGNLARAAVLADRCDDCRDRAIEQDTERPPMLTPVMVSVDADGTAHGYHRCPACGHTWQRYHAV
jgi:hypothetical protein